jgi:hypothetical protein
MKPTKEEMLKELDTRFLKERPYTPEIYCALRVLIEKYGDGEPTEDEMILRKLLWIRHGCDISALYGDDGELQCGQCLIDFKRASAEEISARFTKLSMEKFIKSRSIGVEVEEENP